MSDAIDAQAVQEAMDSLQMMTEALNGMRKQLLAEGWSEANAEQATLMWWAGITRGINV